MSAKSNTHHLAKIIFIAFAVSLLLKIFAFGAVGTLMIAIAAFAAYHWL